MNILIVDDNPKAYREFLDRLAQLGIDRSSIDVEQSGLAGLRRMESKVYDLLVLDIAIPFRPEDEVDPDGALDVLEQVVNGDGRWRPNYIYCVTALDRLSTRVEEFLQDHLIYVLHANSSNSSWILNLVRVVETIRSLEGKERDVAYIKDVCILTAMRTPEFAAVKQLPWSWSESRLLNRAMSYIEGNFHSGGRSRSVVAASCSRMGMVEAALVCDQMIREFRPRLVIMVGICAGYPGDTNLGDVICASPSWNWGSVKIKRDEDGAVRVLPDPDYIDFEEELRPLIFELSEDASVMASIRSGWPADRPPSELKLVVGPMASGSALIADGLPDREHGAETEGTMSELRDTQKRKLVALEMEAYGVFAAVRSVCIRRPLVLVLKGVSDHGNYLKNDRFQTYAAYTSASVCKAFCEKYFGKLIDAKN